MNYRLIAKIAAVFFVSLCLLIPVTQVASLVAERQALRDQVVEDMARSAGFPQTVTGPYLVVPYEQIVRTWTEETQDKPRQLVEHLNIGHLTFLPNEFGFDGNLGIEERKRGIYTARVFNLESQLEGQFELEPHFGIKENIDDYTFGIPYLVLGLSDIRGIGAGLELKWQDKAVGVEPGTMPSAQAGTNHGGPLVWSGVHAPLVQLQSPNESLRATFQVALHLQGTGQLQVVPVGRQSSVSLRSDWPHPSFVGEFLPRTRGVSKQGFDAQWETSFFATNLENIVQRCAGQVGAGETGCVDLQAKAFGVSLINPVDHYLKSDRATKYAFLFIGLTFAVFFLFEVLGRFKVHPIQYGLVGLALAVFFLLLLSLAEHLGFAQAYWISALCSSALIGYYVVPIFGKVSLGLIFGGALTALYAVLYSILGSEDYALLTGSMVVFGVLTVIMVLTRRVNWSAFGQSGESVLRGRKLAPNVGEPSEAGGAIE